MSSDALDCYCGHSFAADKRREVLAFAILAGLLVAALFAAGFILLLPGIIINNIRGRSKGVSAAIRDWQTWLISLPFAIPVVMISLSALKAWNDGPTHRDPEALHFQYRDNYDSDREKNSDTADPALLAYLAQQDAKKQRSLNGSAQTQTKKTQIVGPSPAPATGRAPIEAAAVSATGSLPVMAPNRASYPTVAPSIAHVNQVFSKGAQVRLTQDTPLLFKSEEVRTGRASEMFTVIQHNTSSGRVFVMASDSAGRQVALNVAEDAVEFAPFDVAKLRAALVALCERPDFVNAVAVVKSAAMKAPNDSMVQEYLTSVLAAKAAYDKVIAAAKDADAVRTRIAELSKNAWAARNNFRDPNGGFARSQQMKAEADKLAVDSNAESASAKTEWDSAKGRLASTLSKPTAPTTSLSR